MFVDKCMESKRSYFLRTKKEFIIYELQYVDEIEMAKIKIEKFRCNIAGENKTITEKVIELQKKHYYGIFCAWNSKTKWHC